MDGRSPELLELFFFLMKLNDNEDYQGRNTTKIAVSMSSLKLCCLHCPGKQQNNYEETKGKKKKITKLLPTKPKPKDMSK